MGRLREKGLLIVGMKKIENERHKVAAVPAEIWDALGKMASSQTSDESAPKKSGWLSRFRSRPYGLEALSIVSQHHGILAYDAPHPIHRSSWRCDRTTRRPQYWLPPDFADGDTIVDRHWADAPDAGQSVDIVAAVTAATTLCHLGRLTGFLHVPMRRAPQIGTSRTIPHEVSSPRVGYSFREGARRLPYQQGRKFGQAGTV